MNKKKILILDDDLPIAEMLNKFAWSMGYGVSAYTKASVFFEKEQKVL